MGELHLLAAAILILAGIMNIIGSFIDPILYANAPPPVSGGAQGDPFGSGDMYGGPPGEMGMDDMGMGGPPMGGGPPPPAPAQPPDPYGEGVGAGSAPPGVIDKPPNDDDSDDEDGQMRYDPRTGQWTSKSKTLPTGPFMPGMMGMPMGYNMYGQPVMNPYGGFMPGMIPGSGDEKRSSRELKKAIKRRARKELEKLKRKEEEKSDNESSSEDEDDHSSIRAARYQYKEATRRAREEEERQRAFERQIREEEKRQQMIARGIAIQDARQRAAREVAEEDARMQNYQEMIDNQREMAMTDAQKQVFQDELDQMKEQQQLLLARKTAEMDAAARAAADEELYNRQQGPEVMPYQRQQWQYPPQTSQRRMSYASRTGSPPSYRPSGAESRWPSRGPLKFPGQPSAPPSDQESRRGQQAMRQKHPSPNHHGEEYDSDDITEIQSVGSETSADRRLVAQREREERERVLRAQEKQRQYSRSRGYTR